MQNLEINNIESRRVWCPMHVQPAFLSSSEYIKGISDSLFQQGICLPSGSNMKDKDINRVVNKIKNFFDDFV